MDAHKDPSCIWEGDRIILKKGNTLQSVVVQKDRRYHMERKNWFCLNAAVGMPYGSTFRVEGNSVSLVKPEEVDRICPDIDLSKDNRNLKDTTENQKLSKEHIEKLRDQGVSGENIVDNLVKNSATFKDKTDFAQQKYIKRKQLKHIHEFTVLRPTTRLIAEMHFNKSATKICMLRLDALSQMLSYGNVQAHSKFLVVDGCIGLLLGAVIERMGGFGEILQLYTGQEPVRTALDSYGFTKEVLSIVSLFPLSKLSTITQASAATAMLGTEGSAVPDIKAEAANNVGAVPAKDTEEVEGITDTQPAADNGEEPPLKRQKVETLTGEQEEKESPEKQITNKTPTTETKEIVKKSSRQEALEKGRLLLESEKFDGLLVAIRHYPVPIILQLLPFLMPSRPIVIFCQYKEPLLDCYMKLRDTKCVVKLHLHETWLRHYQVLPNRTHPELNMSNHGGYVLTGIYTKPNTT